MERQTNRPPLRPVTVAIMVAVFLVLSFGLRGTGNPTDRTTVTLDVHENHVKVHCLTEKGARDIQGGELDRRVSAATE